MLYLLTPTNLAHPDWAASSYREVVQVIAESEAAARTIATLRFVTFPESHVRSDASWGPWRNSDLVSAREIETLDDKILTLSRH